MRSLSALIQKSMSHRRHRVFARLKFFVQESEMLKINYVNGILMCFINLLYGVQDCGENKPTFFDQLVRTMVLVSFVFFAFELESYIYKCHIIIQFSISMTI